MSLCTGDNDVGQRAKRSEAHSNVERLHTREEFSRANYNAVGGPMAVHSDIVAHCLLHHGSETQKQKYLPAMVSGECVGAVAMTEPDAGSDLQGVRASDTSELFFDDVGVPASAILGELDTGFAFVDAREQRIYGGTSEIMKELISRSVLA